MVTSIEREKKHQKFEQKTRPPFYEIKNTIKKRGAWAERSTHQQCCATVSLARAAKPAAGAQQVITQAMAEGRWAEA